MGIDALRAWLFLISLACATGQTLPGTLPLTLEGDPAAQMIEGMHRFLDRELAGSIKQRQRLWHRDFSSRAAYEKSVADNRERFRKIIGVVDERVADFEPIPEATVSRHAVAARGRGYTVYVVRWPVLPGVDAEGLLLKPNSPPIADVIALPDADLKPEMLAGSAAGLSPAGQFGRRLTEQGCRVLIPVLIDRQDTWSGDPKIRLTNQTHREFIYRMSYELGRHIIGYEVQKVLAAVDWFSRSRPQYPSDTGKAACWPSTARRQTLAFERRPSAVIFSRGRTFGESRFTATSGRFSRISETRSWLV
jgi:hypothetical protein